VVTLGQCNPNLNFARKYLASNLKIGGYETVAVIHGLNYSLRCFPRSDGRRIKIFAHTQ